MSEQSTQNEKSLAVLETKLSYIIKTVDEIHAHVRKTNGRVSSLENWRSYTAGALAVLVFLSGYIVIIYDKLV